MNDLPSAGSKLVTSLTISELAGSLAKAQGEFKAIKKNKVAEVKGKTQSGNDYKYEYKYADLGDIGPEIMPILSKHGLCYIQPTDVDGGTIYIYTRLMHSSGEWIESVYPVASYTQTSHQKIGAALTYAKRYALCSLLGIVAEEDMDAQDGMAATAGDHPKRQQRPTEREQPAVVQGGATKSLPPVVKPQPKEQDPFYLTDQYGQPEMEPLSEQQFVDAFVSELNDCIVHQAVGQLMEINEKAISRCSDTGKARISNAYEARVKAVRREMHEGQIEA